MNNTVDIYFEEDDVTETYKLVTTVRSNSLKNLISRESPLGAAIFGHKAGDSGAGLKHQKDTEAVNDNGKDKCCLTT